MIVNLGIVYTYSPVREGLDAAAHDEPLDAVANEAYNGADE